MSSNRKKRGGGEGSDNRLFAAISEDDVHHELEFHPHGGLITSGAGSLKYDGRQP